MFSKVFKSFIAFALVLLTVACGGKTATTSSEKVVTNDGTESESVNSLDEVVEKIGFDEVKEVTITPEEIKEFSEAPELANLVASGDLPPVEERLPVQSDVFIQGVFDEVGVYGGDFKMPWLGGNAQKWEVGRLTEESLFRFTQDGSDVEPNIAKGYDVNDEKTEYTIYLREGMKWSDGEDVTADDVIFWYEELLKTKFFGKSPYACFYSVNLDENGEELDKALMTMEKVDDYTVKMTHKYPSPLFLKKLAIDAKWAIAPEHFYESFVPTRVGDEEALRIAQEWGFQDVKSFGKMIAYYYWLFPERPTLRPWVIVNDSESNQAIYERNPYYWKVDENGQQLPYMDRVVLDKYQDKSHFTLEALGGNISFSTFSLEEFTTLKENEESGNFDVKLWKRPDLSALGLHFNQTAKDEELREIFRDIRFREAISIAMDREEISEIVYDGLVEPLQFAVHEGRPFYNEEWTKKWTEQDVDRANQLLDEIGITWNEGDDYRTLPSGKQFAFPIHILPEEQFERFAELLSVYLKDLGILVEVKVVDKTFYEELRYSNEIVSTATAATIVDASLRSETIIPLRVMEVWYGNYGLYTQTNGAEGTEPEGDIAELLRLWNVISSSTTQEEIDEAVQQIWDIHMENQYVLGATGPSPQLIAVSKDLKNVPNNVVWADEYRFYGHAKPYQFFFANQE